MSLWKPIVLRVSKVDPDGTTGFGIGIRNPFDSNFYRLQRARCKWIVVYKWAEGGAPVWSPMERWEFPVVVDVEMEFDTAFTVEPQPGDTIYIFAVAQGASGRDVCSPSDVQLVRSLTRGQVIS